MTRYLTVCYASALLLSALAGCTTAMSPTSGRVADGVYYSPLNNFSIPVPNWRALAIQDRQERDFAIVSFLDRGDMPASLQSIASMRLPPDAQAAFDDPSRRDAEYRRFLTGFAMPALFQSVSPQSTIAHEEFLDQPDGRFFFAVVDIPEGHSSLLDAKAGKQMSSVSGLLIFHHKGFVYMARSEMRTLFNVNLNASSLSPADLESARKSLLRIRGAMKFTD